MTAPNEPLGPDPTLEDEERALKRGKGAMMAAMMAVPLLAVALVLAWSLSDGGDESYRILGRNLNGLRQSRFDVFWGCALDGVNPATLRNNTELMTQLEQRGGGPRRRAWAGKVRDECLGHLDALERELSALIPPEALFPKVTELKTTTGSLRSAWSGYIAYLEAVRTNGYDEAAAHEHVVAVARAWYDYRRLHAELNDAVREKIEPE